jgi:predicted nucleic acid-binding protein
MIFVDTSGWFASVVTKDINHDAASRWLQQNREPLLTTDHVVDELLTLLKARDQLPVALSIGQRLLDGKLAQLHHLTEADFREAWQVFQQFADKDWSFTDCTSKVVMEKLGVKQAFAFDQHFKQFGSIAVVP